MNILIMRTFVRLRELLATNSQLAERIGKIEQTQRQHGAALVSVIQDVQRLKNSPVPPKRRIGFHNPDQK